MSISVRVIIDTYLLGDQVFTGAFVASVAQKFKNDEIVWVTSSKSAPLSAHIAPNVRILVLDVPWCVAGWYHKPWKLAVALFKIKRLKNLDHHSVGISARGGWIQRWVAWRLGVGRLIEGDAVPSDWKSRLSGGYSRPVAEVYDTIFAKLIGDPGARVTWPYLPQPPRTRPTPGASALNIILAPEASLELKEWPRRHWGLLYRELTDRGCNCRLLLHQTEASDYGEGLTSFKAGFGALSAGMATTDLFIGLDSFAGHFAAAHGVPVVLLYATGASAIWSHPRTSLQVIIDPVAESGVVFSRKTQWSGGLRNLTVDEVMTRIGPVLQKLSSRNEV